MIIVNITNCYQAYINISTAFSQQSFQYVILGFGLLTFVLSFIFSVLSMLKDSNTTPNTPEIKHTVPKFNETKSFRQKLNTAFLKLEEARSLIINLEDLKSNNIINDDSYYSSLKEYELLKNTALESLNEIKSDIQAEMNSIIESRNRMEKTFKGVKQDHLSGTISNAIFRNKESYYNWEIKTHDQKITSLQSLIDANGTYDVMETGK